MFDANTKHGRQHLSNTLQLLYAFVLMPIKLPHNGPLTQSPVILCGPIW